MADTAHAMPTSAPQEQSRLHGEAGCPHSSGGTGSSEPPEASSSGADKQELLGQQQRRSGRRFVVHKKTSTSMQRPKVDYVQRLKEYREAGLSIVREARMTAEREAGTTLPDLKTALEAVARREAAAAAAAAGMEPGAAQGYGSRPPSTAGRVRGSAASTSAAPSRSMSIVGARAGSSQGRRASKRQSTAQYIASPPRTPPRAPGSASAPHRLHASRAANSIGTSSTAASSTAKPHSTSAAVGSCGAAASLPKGSVVQPSPAASSQLLPAIAPAASQSQAASALPPLAASAAPVFNLPIIPRASISSACLPSDSGSRRPSDSGAPPSGREWLRTLSRRVQSISYRQSGIGGILATLRAGPSGGSNAVSSSWAGPLTGPAPVQAPLKPRRRSALEMYQDVIQVDPSELFLPDARGRPDTEDEAQLHKSLKKLKNLPAQHDKDEEVTYSHLVKPRVRSARRRATFPGAEDGWEPDATLNWSNRGISIKKMGLLQDMLLQNTFLTGLQLAGNTMNTDCVVQLLALLSRPGSPRITQLDLSGNAGLDWRCAYVLARALGARDLTAPEQQLVALRPLAAEAGSVSAMVGPGAAAGSGPKAAAGSEQGKSGTGGGGGGVDAVAVLPLARLVLADVKIGDKGAVAMAAALQASETLKDLSLSRCSITDQGGAAVMQALSCSCIESLDLSWNSLRGMTTRALHDALQTNGALQLLNLSYNGLSDADTARALAGLLRHGTWRHVDVSNNNVTTGSALVVTEIMRCLGKKSADCILAGTYAQHWAAAASFGRVRRRSFPGSRPTSGRVAPAAVQDPNKPPGSVPTNEALGYQLKWGPAQLNVSGNPLGLAGLREILRSMAWMSSTVEGAVTEAKARRRKEREQRREQRRRELREMRTAGRHKLEALVFDEDEGEQEEEEEEEEDTDLCTTPDWPLQVIVDGCNVEIPDSLPPEAAAEGLDLHSPNPYLPSLAKAAGWAEARPDPDQADPPSPGSSPKPAPAPKVPPAGPGKKGSAAAAAKDKDAPPPIRIKVKYPLTCQSQRLDLRSPAGKYCLDMSHAASALLIRQLLALVSELDATSRHTSVSGAGKGQAGAAAEGSGSGSGGGGAVRISDVWINERFASPKQLLDTAHKELNKGSVAFTVDAPAVVCVSTPVAAPPQLVAWLCGVLGGAAVDERCSDMWKLSVARVACSHFLFSWDQAVQLLESFDAVASLRIMLSEILYARCTNPLDFWLKALPCLPQSQADTLTERLDEYPALNINNPTGRFTLSLSRSTDRAIAARLQEAAVLEAPWTSSSRHSVNWHNATLDGKVLRPEVLRGLRRFTIPDTGTLSLDFVSYKPLDPDARPCTDAQLARLLGQLRAANNDYHRQLLQLGKEAHAEIKHVLSTFRLPGESFRQQADAAAEDKRWHVTRVLGTPLRKMAAELRVPLPDPEPQPSATSPKGARLGSLTRQGSVARQPSGARRSATVGATRQGTLARQGSKSARSAGAAAAAAAAADGATAAAPPPLWWQHVADASFRAAAKEIIDAFFPASLTLRRTARMATDSGSVPLSPSAARALVSEPSRRSVAASEARVEEEEEDEEEEEELPPPHLRCPGAHMTSQQAEQARELAALVLQLRRAQEAVRLLTKCGPVHIARVLHTLMEASDERGPKVAALLVEHLSPVLAVRLLFVSADMAAPAILPPDERQALAAAIKPEVLRLLSGLNAKVTALAASRARQVRVALQCFAATHHVSTAHLFRIVHMLRYESDRCTAVVSLFPRLTDREYVYEVLQGMRPDEQRQVMQRLGPWHVWLVLQSCPVDWGDVHFCLDLSDAEQRDVAQDIVLSAVKATTRMKAQAATQQQQQDVRQLLHMRADGAPLVVEEDDRMWAVLHNRCKLLEFDMAPSLDQLDFKRELSAAAIQRAWRKTRKQWRHLYQVPE